jgi:4a-hydroxytetrahydrobiopterin dehydratase
MTEVLKAGTERLTARQFLESTGVGDWRVVGDGATAYFRTGSLAAGARFTQAISELPGIDEHGPDIDVRHAGVTARLITIGGDAYGLSQRDVALARRISEIARRLELPADPSLVQSVQVTIDALVRPESLPFWRAVLGYSDRPGSSDELRDPRGRGPVIYFQQMQEPRPERNCIHIDVWVPPEVARARVEAAVAAGGRIVSDGHAPSWWVLADAEGNEACVAVRSEHLDF